METFAVTSCRFGPLLVDYDERVLTPRPWTLKQSEWAARLAAAAAPGPLLEVCAGAGHIGLAAAVLADRDLVQIEADPVAAGYARANAARAGWSERVQVRNTRLEQALQPEERFEVIVADPPYLRSAEIGRWPEDPQLAIDGGVDGMEVVQACLALAGQHLSEAGQLLLQTAGPAQDERVGELLQRHPEWRLVGRDGLVVDEERAIMRIERSAR